MYKLYYSPGACSMAPHVILNEVGAKFELVNSAIQEGKTRTAEFLKINPRGQIPVLEDEGFIIREGAAIIIHLLEKHNSPLLPQDGNERTAALEWLMFCNATLHPAYGRGFFLMRNVSDQAVKDQLLGITVDNINKLWEEVENRLTKNEYLAGKNLTAADILLAVIANWSRNFPKPINFGPKTKKLFKTVTERPSYKKALEVEKVEYKAAA